MWSQTLPSGSSSPGPARSFSRTRSGSPRRRRSRRLVERMSILGVPIGGHFHDTRHTGVANAWAAVESGATVLDASIGGLGGCPFAPRATGNVATEDVLYLLDRERVETGVDLEALIGVARWLEELLGRGCPAALPTGRVSPTSGPKAEPRFPSNSLLLGFGDADDAGCGQLGDLLVARSRPRAGSRPCARRGAAAGCGAGRARRRATAAAPAVGDPGSAGGGGPASARAPRSAARRGCPRRPRPVLQERPRR